MRSWLTAIPMPYRWKRTLLVVVSLLLGVVACPFGLGLCCNLQYLFMFDRYGTTALLLNLVLLVLLLAGGGTLLWHIRQSLGGRASRPVRLPPMWLLVGIFALLVLISVRLSSSFLFAFFLPVMATLPPLWALSWFMRGQPGGFTWRRGVPAFVGGATLGVFIALILNMLLPLFFIVLIRNLAEPLFTNLGDLLTHLANQQIADALTNPGLVFLLIQVAVVAPLVEEVAKPLATLPLVGRLPRREAFLVGAAAGVGFAAVENILYAASGYGFWRNFWVGVLLLRSIGAVHPLGSGLMALAWRDLFNGEPGARRAWLRRFAVAAGMHALWNGGLTVVTVLAGAEFFGQLPPELDLLGVSMGGVTLALIIVLGLTSLWLGRSIAQQAQQPELRLEAAPDARLILSDRALVVWALLCLVALVPLGITTLQLVLR